MTSTKDAFVLVLLNFTRRFSSKNITFKRYLTVSRIKINGEPDTDEKCHEYSKTKAQMIKNLPAMQETWVQSLDWADPLEKETATHSSILAWRNPWAGEPEGLQSMGS